MNQTGARANFSFEGVVEISLQQKTMQIKSLHLTMQYNTTAYHGQTQSATPLTLKLQGGRAGAQETEHPISRNLAVTLIAQPIRYAKHR